MNVKLITILEDEVFLIIIIQITTYDPSYNFCLKENFLIFLLMAY